MSDCLQNVKAVVDQVPGTTCPAVGYQTATVCVPVTVTPTADVLPSTTYCCGGPVITPGTTCSGTINASCIFTMTQNVCIAVPVEFSANTSVGEPSVTCGDATSENVCRGCH